MKRKEICHSEKDRVTDWERVCAVCLKPHVQKMKKTYKTHFKHNGKVVVGREKESKLCEWKQYVINNYNHRWSHLNVCAVSVYVCVCCHSFFLPSFHFIFVLSQLTHSFSRYKSKLDKRENLVSLHVNKKSFFSSHFQSKSMRFFISHVEVEKQAHNLCAFACYIIVTLENTDSCWLPHCFPSRFVANNS